MGIRLNFRRILVMLIVISELKIISTFSSKGIFGPPLGNIEELMSQIKTIINLYQTMTKKMRVENGTKIFENKMEYIKKSEEKMQPLLNIFSILSLNCTICRLILKEDVGYIWAKFTNFKNVIIEHSKESTKRELIKWSKLMLAKYSDTKRALIRIRKSIQREQLFDKIKKEISCGFKMSQNQIIYSFYYLLQLTHMKVYAMDHFAFMVLTEQNENNNKINSASINFIYKLRANFFLKHTQMALKEATKTIWRCDPEKYEKGKTYDQINNLLQGISINMEDVLTLCEKNCDAVTNKLRTGRYKFHDKEKCNGKIQECKEIGYTVHICFSPSSSLRRYEYMLLNLEGSKASNLGCAEKNKKTKVAKMPCRQCFCLCDGGDKQSNRYLYTGEVLANIAENNVVTGVRFKRNKIDTPEVFHLQIQMGKLLSNGEIELNSTTWIPLPKDPHKNSCKLDYNSRSMDLDTILVPAYEELKKDHIITGVQLQVNNGHINLRINCMEFDFMNGKLIKNTNKWINSKIPPTSRKLIELNNAHISTKTPKPSQLINYAPNSFMKFNYTGVAQDAAQTTIPFLDIQEVQSQIPTPICGVGIYYKGHQGYGGFFAPKIVTCDFGHHLEMLKYDIEI